MAKSSSKRSQFWRADWFVGVLVVLAVLFPHSFTDLSGPLERRYYDDASTSTSRQPLDRIAIIAIDDQSIANIGRWPWPRDVHVQLIDQLSAAKAKTIAYTTFFFEPQTGRGLTFIHKMKEVLADPTVAQGGVNEQLGKVIVDAEIALDTDAKLAASMGKAGNVLVPSMFTLGFFVVLLVVAFGMLSAAATWLKLVFPAALLIIGHLALTTKRFPMTEAGKFKSDEESAETNRMMGLALQGQGQLDMAFDHFRRVSFTDALMDNLNNLALDFEHQRQFNKAQAVYEYRASHDKDHKDLQSRLNRAKNLSGTVILGGGGAHPGGTMLLDGDGLEKPMLGRYQVEKELGKGAMGVVYLGKDPKIGRVVAIKTIALSQEFEGEELEDARERFFRAAETAGRLQHQNIVTIFDTGEEHDLAYIAMEFLKGKDLADVTKGGQWLPMPRVLSIVARVAEALAYAHKQNVVHRDIKPANIMYDLDSDSVKVTDFGIARITNSSKTKTGLLLGTPSFMSPEQIAGKKVDGRSDLYSLGVMLLQMLAGVLPFRGASMAELMYKIENEPAPDIRSIRNEISGKLADVVALALRKRPEARYQDGDQFAADLRAVMTEMASTADALSPMAPVTGRQPPETSEKTAAFAATSVGQVPQFDATVVLPVGAGSYSFGNR